MIKVFIRSHQVYSKPLEYILSVLAKNKSLSITFTEEKSNARLVFDHEDPLSQPINSRFFDSLLSKHIFDHEAYFENEPFIHFQNSNTIDWLSTSFYMINAFQEYGLNPDKDSFDKYGRFRYEKSYQKKFNCIGDNLVQKCFDNFCNENLSSEVSQNMKSQTRIFLSHDVDTIYGSFLQDGFWAIKKGRFDIILKLILNEILRNPHWKNIDKISKLHSDHDLTSTFFWLATKKISENRVKNADYSIFKHKDLIRFSQSNGLHKSCHSSNINEELKMLPFNTTLNRYHFLKFNLPTSWEDIDNSRIKLDSSLGFAENYGFRNNYGKPFKPYNISTKSAYNFIEVPLNVMDGTLHRYMKIPTPLTAVKIIDFIENNKSNCILSILWHNTYFTNYKFSGYLQEYKKILLYLNESGISSITPEEIINTYLND